MTTTARGPRWHDFFLEIHERIRTDIHAVKGLATAELTTGWRRFPPAWGGNRLHPAGPLLD